MYRCNKPNNTNTMNKDMMKTVILNNVTMKIDELIEEMSTNEFKEMILDEYFLNTKVSLEDVDSEINEIISKVSKIIELDDEKIISIFSRL